MGDAIQAAFEQAITRLKTDGLLTVVLGGGCEEPKQFRTHPRIYWLHATEGLAREAESALPANTRLMIYAGDIPHGAFKALRWANERRRIPFMGRHTQAAMVQELEKLIPMIGHVDNVMADAPFEAPAPLDIVEDRPDPQAAEAREAVEAVFRPAEPAGDEMAKRKAQHERGAVNEFVRKHANLEAGTSIADEARRLLKVAQKEGLTTTFGSLSQAMSNLKRQGRLGTRPDSAQDPVLTGQASLMIAVDNAIATLTKLRERVGKIDADQEALRHENQEMRTRIGLMKEAFEKL